MKRLILILMLGALCACNSSDAWDILKSSGHTRSVTRQLDDFGAVDIPENMEISVFVQDTVSKVVITAGRNLIPDIKTYITDGTLRVKDRNGFGIFRDNTRIVRIAVYTRRLSSFRATTGQDISIQSSKELGNLEISLPGCSGDLSASLNASNLYLTLVDATSKVTLSGHATTISYSSGQSFGPVDLSALHTKVATLLQSGSNDVFVSADDTLRMRITGMGNVYYSGNPVVIATITGRGSAIKR